MTSRHLIHRQTIELTLPPHLDPHSLQETIGRVCRDGLPTLIDHLCSEMVGPHELLQLSHLEIDLGMFALADLEADFIPRFGPAFTSALRREIAANPAAVREPAAAALALLSHFLTRGTLPWWIDVAQPDLLAQQVTAFIDQAQAAQKQSLRRILAQPGAGVRLAAHLEDVDLLRLLTALHPDLHPLLPVWPPLLAGLMGRAHLWAISPAVLRTAAWSELIALAGITHATDERFLAVLLLRLGLRLGTTTRRLVEEIGQATPELETVLSRLAFDGETAAAAVEPRTALSSPSPDDAEDAADYPLLNGGLVILWPFLNRLWEQLDLLDGGQFQSPAAQQRAVYISQALVQPRELWPEYLLVLNKVLCGLPVDHPMLPQEPLTVAELTACEALLAAIIIQIPILGQMTPDGFRASFLLRPGLLTAEGGGWRLRIERRIHDIVFEKFPWSWTWVKLPWMDHVLRVEW